jgi:SAF domain
MVLGTTLGHSGRRLPGAGRRDGAGDGAATDSRTLGPGRHRALPAGRAVIGGFLVAVAAVVVFAAALTRSSSPGQSWLVASRPLAAGTVLGPGDLTTATMRLPGSTATLAFRQASAIEGRSLAVALQSGELIQGSMLVAPNEAPALRPVSVAVNPVSLANLSPGQLVDVLASQGSGTDTTVTVVARGATLIDMVTSGSALLAPGGTGQVTIGVGSLAEVEAVIEASQSGTVSLVAAEQSDGVGPGRGGTS